MHCQIYLMCHCHIFVRGTAKLPVVDLAVLRTEIWLCHVRVFGSAEFSSIPHTESWQCNALGLCYGLSKQAGLLEEGLLQTDP